MYWLYTLLAQASIPPEVGGSGTIGIWLNVLANVGGLTILFFIVRTTVPNVMDRFDKMVNGFLESLEKQRQHDSTESKFERQQCQDHHDRVVKIIEVSNDTTQALLRNMRTDQAIIMSVFTSQQKQLAKNNGDGIEGDKKQ